MKLGARAEAFWCSVFRDRLPEAIETGADGRLTDEERRRAAVEEAAAYADEAVAALRRRQGISDPTE